MESNETPTTTAPAPVAAYGKVPGRNRHEIGLVLAIIGLLLAIVLPMNDVTPALGIFLGSLGLILSAVGWGRQALTLLARIELNTRR
jgi:hypothetical protein